MPDPILSRHLLFLIVLLQVTDASAQSHKDDLVPTQNLQVPAQESASPQDRCATLYFATGDQVPAFLDSFIQGFLRHNPPRRNIPFGDEVLAQYPLTSIFSDPIETTPVDPTTHTFTLKEREALSTVSESIHQTQDIEAHVNAMIADAKVLDEVVTEAEGSTTRWVEADPGEHLSIFGQTQELPRFLLGKVIIGNSDDISTDSDGQVRWVSIRWAGKIRRIFSTPFDSLRNKFYAEIQSTRGPVFTVPLSRSDVSGNERLYVLSESL